MAQVYEIVERRSARKGGDRVVAVVREITRKNGTTRVPRSGNDALRNGYGCNVEPGGKSTYTTKRGRKLRARPVKA